MIAAALALASAAAPAAEPPRRGAAVQVRAWARVLAGVRVRQSGGAPASGPYMQLSRTARGGTMIEFL